MKSWRRKILASLLLLASIGLSPRWGEPDGKAGTGVAVYSTEPLPRELTTTEIDRPLGAADCHRYVVGMAVGQVLDVEVLQAGVDVIVTVTDETGDDPLVFDSPMFRDGPDGGTYVSRRDGGVRVTVCGGAGESSAVVGGRYRIRRAQLRAAEPADLRLEQAFRSYRSGCETEDPKAARRELEAARDGFHAVGRPREEGWAWLKIAKNLEASARSNTSEWSAAEAAYRESAALHFGVGDLGHSAKVLLFQGALLQDHLRRPRAALVVFGEALRRARAAKDSDHTALALIGLARCRAVVGQMVEALSAYEDAAEIFRRSGRAADECDARLRIGRLYLNGHDLGRALDAIGEARRIARTEGLSQQEANALTQMAEVRLESGQGRLALKLLTDAEVVAPAGNARDRFDRANALGRAYSQLGELERAAAAYETAIQAARQRPELMVNARINLARLFERRGDFEGAVRTCQASLPAAVSGGLRRDAAAAFACIAYNRVNQGRLEDALVAVRQAVTMIEELRSRYAQEDLRTSFFADKQRYFDLYLEITYRLFRRDGDPDLLEESFEVAEHSKARTLVDGLAVGEMQLERDADPDLLDLRERLHEERARLLAAELTGSEMGPRRAAASGDHERIEELDAELDALRGRILSHHPGWRDALALRPVDLATVRSVLLRGGETQIVSYFLGERIALVWVVGETSLVVRELDDPRKVGELADRTSRLLAESSTPMQRNAAERALAELARKVVDPIADDLTASQLILVKSGALDAIPFAGFPLSRVGGAGSVFFGQRYRLVEAPSASAAVLLRSDRIGRAPAPLALAIFADPVFREDDDRIVSRGRAPAQQASERSGRGFRFRLGDLPRLKGSRREAEAIAELVADPAQKLVAFGFDVNREQVTSGVLARYRMIHFATHGIAEPGLSALVLSLWDRHGQSTPSNLLGEWEIYDLDLDADLVVLSACRTGLGTRVPGEGVMSLARAFLWAGASRVVVTLWDVDDEATARLMVSFYDRMLHHGDPPAEALRRAQAVVRSDPRWESPHYWAGFVLQGDGS